MKRKALSIQQPWAWAILHAGKDVENRSWSTNFRGRIVVHAGKRYDQDGHDFLVSQGYHVPDSLPCGLVGEVDITGCVHVSATKSPWAFGPYCFTLDNSTAYDNPISANGRLGFFEVEVPT